MFRPKLTITSRHLPTRAFVSPIQPAKALKYHPFKKKDVQKTAIKEGLALNLATKTQDSKPGTRAYPVSSL